MRPSTLNGRGFGLECIGIGREHGLIRCWRPALHRCSGPVVGMPARCHTARLLCQSHEQPRLPRALVGPAHQGPT